MYVSNHIPSDRSRLLGRRVPSGGEISHIDKRGPIHPIERQVVAPDAGEAQDGHHDGDEAAGGDPRGQAGGAEMPGPAAEAVADEDDLEEDGDGEGDVGSDGADAEDGVDGGATEDEQQQDDADARVEPHRVHGRERVPVDLLERPADDTEAVVARVGEAHARRCDHAALPHRVRADDRHR